MPTGFKKGVKGATGSPVPKGSTEDLFNMVVPLLEKFDETGLLDDDEIEALVKVVSIIQSRKLTPDQENELDTILFVIASLLEDLEQENIKTVAESAEEKKEEKQDEADKLVKQNKEVSKLEIDQQNTQSDVIRNLKNENRQLIDKLNDDVNLIFGIIKDLKVTDQEKLIHLENMLGDESNIGLKLLLPKIYENVLKITMLEDKYTNEKDFINNFYLTIGNILIQNKYLHPTSKLVSSPLRIMMNQFLYTNLPERPKGTYTQKY